MFMVTTYNFEERQYNIRKAAEVYMLKYFI